MKKILISGVILFASWAAHAAEFPPVQNRGAVVHSTMTAIAASTTPVICLSTGTNVVLSYGQGGGPTSTKISTATVVFGQYMRDRLYTEFFNDTSTDVWIGSTIDVSTRAGANYGRRLVPGSAWANDGAIQNYFVVASTTTERKLVITQQR